MKEAQEKTRQAKRTRTWYVVTVTFPNSGNYHAAITATIVAPSKPRDTIQSKSWADVWTNHYGTHAAAVRAVRHYTSTANA